MNSSIHYLWVKNEQQLAEICQNARQVPAVALDTKLFVSALSTRNWG